MALSAAGGGAAHGRKVGLLGRLSGRRYLRRRPSREPPSRCEWAGLRATANCPTTVAPAACPPRPVDEPRVRAERKRGEEGGDDGEYGDDFMPRANREHPRPDHLVAQAGGARQEEHQEETVFLRESVHGGAGPAGEQAAGDQQHGTGSRRWSAAGAPRCQPERHVPVPMRATAMRRRGFSPWDCQDAS